MIVKKAIVARICSSSACRHPKSVPSLLLLIAAVCLASVSVGCRDEDWDGNAEMLQVDSAGLPEQDHFAIAIDFLKMRDEHNLDRSAGQANYHLNRWAREQLADAEWQVDRRWINTLPDAVRSSPAGKELLSDAALARLEFTISDVVAMEEARWLQAIARLVAATEPSAEMKSWLDDQQLSESAAESLMASQAAFDWVIRNIQLDELLEYPTTATAGPTVNPDENNATANWPPPMQAIPGPGYNGLVWHVLLYGHGDAYQRARVFMLLCRQLRIDAVMLGIDTKVGRARPWLPAVLVNGQLYLFDDRLGLPVPDPSGQGIATLAQVLEDPSILRRLDMGQTYIYPIQPEDLEKVVAMIDVSPEYLSQRMLLAERRLSAADQMILSVSLQPMVERLRPCTGLVEVRLWAVPIEACVYQRAYTAKLIRDPELQWEEFVKHGVFEELTPLVKGRRYQLIGRFNKQGDDEGATHFFQLARLTDDTLEDLEASRQIQKSLGLERPPNIQDEEWNARLEQLKRLQVESKENASYWMGLLHQQQGNYQVAVNWLSTRTLEKTPDGPWTHGARYNLARCFEAIDQAKEAIQLYRIDESPQRHGNLLRAQHLEAQVPEEAAADEAAAAPGADESATEDNADAAPQAREDDA